jgi:hypothetical protein
MPPSGLLQEAAAVLPENVSPVPIGHAFGWTSDPVRTLCWESNDDISSVHPVGDGYTDRAIVLSKPQRSATSKAISVTGRGGL